MNRPVDSVEAIRAMAPLAAHSASWKAELPRICLGPSRLCKIQSQRLVSGTVRKTRHTGLSYSNNGLQNCSLAPQPVQRLMLCAASSSSSKVVLKEGPAETVYFDGGTHYGDFILNFILGLTGVWLPITLASLFRTLNLRYRFTDRRFTITSALDAGDRADYPYSSVAEVRSLPRFIGEWGDLSIVLKDKTVVEFKALPKFREVAKFVEEKARKAEPLSPKPASTPKGFK